jgi:hypothetical protein
MKLRFFSLVSLSLFGCGNVPNASEVIASPTRDASLPSDCMALQTCCPTLPSEVVTSCKSLAAQATDTQCAKEVSALQASAHCLTSPPPQQDASSDAASSTSTTDAGPVACILLDTCCSSPALMMSQTVMCQDAVSAADESSCSTMLAHLAGSQDCSALPGVPPSGGGCPALSTCCGSESLPTSDITACEETASAGDDTACTQLFDSLAASGYCGPSVTLRDGGHLLTAGCMMLSMCCGEITFPQGTLSTCDMIAGANNDGTCLSAYDSYSALAYCQ